jgi:predicted Zn-dependent protease
MNQRICSTLILCFFIVNLLASCSSKTDVKAFGLYVDRKVLTNKTLVLDKVVEEKIGKVGARVAKAADCLTVDYAFMVLNEPAINAFSTSSGYIYITTGFLDVLKKEDELAAALAREIAHICKNHHYDFVASAHQKKNAKKLAGYAISTGVGIAIGTTLGALVGAAFPLPTASPNPYSAYLSVIETLAWTGSEDKSKIDEFAFLLAQGSYHGEQELEADLEAVVYLKKAGYDPHGLLTMLNTLKIISDNYGFGKQHFEIHYIDAEPGLEERINQIEPTLSKQIKDNDNQAKP